MMGVYLVISHYYKEAITSRLFHTPQPGSTATSYGEKRALYVQVLILLRIQCYANTALLRSHLQALIADAGMTNCINGFWS